MFARAVNATLYGVPSDRGQREGEVVYRVCGGESRQDGNSWTPVDPRTVPDYRPSAGLPDRNAGDRLVVGRLVDDTGVLRGLCTGVLQ